VEVVTLITVSGWRTAVRSHGREGSGRRLYLLLQKKKRTSRTRGKTALTRRSSPGTTRMSARRRPPKTTEDTGSSGARGTSSREKIRSSTCHLSRNTGRSTGLRQGHPGRGCGGRRGNQQCQNRRVEQRHLERMWSCRSALYREAAHPCANS
jgi:hypothetical protein